MYPALYLFLPKSNPVLSLLHFIFFSQLSNNPPLPKPPPSELNRHVNSSKNSNCVDNKIQGDSSSSHCFCNAILGNSGFLPSQTIKLCLVGRLKTLGFFLGIYTVTAGIPTKGFRLSIKLTMFFNISRAQDTLRTIAIVTGTTNQPYARALLWAFVLFVVIFG